MIFQGKVFTSSAQLDKAFKDANVNPTSNDFLMKLVMEEAAFRSHMEEKHGVMAYGRPLAHLRGQRQTVDSLAFIRSLKTAIHRPGACTGQSDAVRKAKAALQERRALRAAERSREDQAEPSSSSRVSCSRSPSPAAPPARSSSSSDRSTRRMSPKRRHPRSPTPASDDSDCVIQEVRPARRSRKPKHRKSRHKHKKASARRHGDPNLLFDPQGFMVIDPLGEHSTVRREVSVDAPALNYDPLANVAERWLHEMYDSEDERRKEREHRARARHGGRWGADSSWASKKKQKVDPIALMKERKAIAALAEQRRLAMEAERASKRAELRRKADLAMLSFQEVEEE